MYLGSPGAPITRRWFRRVGGQPPEIFAAPTPFPAKSCAPCIPLPQGQVSTGTGKASADHIYDGQFKLGTPGAGGADALLTITNANGYICDFGGGVVGGGVTLASGRNIGWNVQKGRTWNGQPVEGLLLNSRMVQATFNDRNPDTVERWAYPDTKKWDADRNTAEFIEMMPTWRKHGLLAVTLNLQGGSPEGYSKVQPWHNSAINSDGTLDEKTMARLAKVVDKADELGLVVILGLYYFGQDERVKDEKAGRSAQRWSTRSTATRMGGSPATGCWLATELLWKKAGPR